MNTFNGYLIFAQELLDRGALTSILMQSSLCALVWLVCCVFSVCVELCYAESES